MPNSSKAVSLSEQISNSSAQVPSYNDWSSNYFNDQGVVEQPRGVTINSTSNMQTLDGEVAQASEPERIANMLVNSTANVSKNNEKILNQAEKNLNLSDHMSVSEVNQTLDLLRNENYEDHNNKDWTAIAQTESQTAFHDAQIVTNTEDAGYQSIFAGEGQNDAQTQQVFEKNQLSDANTAQKLFAYVQKSNNTLAQKDHVSLKTILGKEGLNPNNPRDYNPNMITDENMDNQFPDEVTRSFDGQMAQIRQDVAGDQKVLNAQPDAYFTKSQVQAVKRQLDDVRKHISQEQRLDQSLKEAYNSAEDDANGAENLSPTTLGYAKDADADKAYLDTVAGDIKQEQTTANGISKDISQASQGFHFKDVIDQVPQKPTYQQANAAAHRLYSYMNWGSYDWISNGDEYAPKSDMKHPTNQNGQLMWYDPSDPKAVNEWASDANWPNERPGQYAGGLRIANTGTLSTVDIAGGPTGGFWNSNPSLQTTHYLDPREIVLISELSPTDKRPDNGSYNQEAKKLNGAVSKLESDFRKLPNSAAVNNIQEAYIGTKAAAEGDNIHDFDMARDVMLKKLDQLPLQYQATIMKDFARLDDAASQIVTDKAILARYSHQFVQEHPQHFALTAPHDPTDAQTLFPVQDAKITQEKQDIANLEKGNDQLAQFDSKLTGHHIASGNARVKATSQNAQSHVPKVTLNQTIKAEKELYQGFTPYRSTDDTTQGIWNWFGDPNTTGNQATTKMFDWKNPSAEALTIAKTSPFALSFSNQTFQAAQDMIHLGSAVDNADPTPQTSTLNHCFQEFKNHAQMYDSTAYDIAKTDLKQAIKLYNEQPTVLPQNAKILNETFTAAVKSSDPVVQNRAMIEQYLHQAGPQADAGFSPENLALENPSADVTSLQEKETALEKNYQSLESAGYGVQQKAISLDEHVQSVFRGDIQKEADFANASHLSPTQLAQKDELGSELTTQARTNGTDLQKLDGENNHLSQLQNSLPASAEKHVIAQDQHSIETVHNDMSSLQQTDGAIATILPDLNNNGGAMGISVYRDTIQGKDISPALAKMDQDDLEQDKTIANDLSPSGAEKGQIQNDLKQIDQHIAQDETDSKNLQNWSHTTNTDSQKMGFLGSIVQGDAQQMEQDSGAIKSDVTAEKGLGKTVSDDLENADDHHGGAHAQQPSSPKGHHGAHHQKQPHHETDGHGPKGSGQAGHSSHNHEQPSPNGQQEPTGQQVAKLESGVSNDLHTLGGKLGDACVTGDDAGHVYDRFMKHLQTKHSTRFEPDKQYNNEFHHIQQDTKALESMDTTQSQERAAYTDLSQNAAELNQQAAHHALCFCSGTMIKTTQGETCVEDLCVGDIVITARGEQKRISWIGHQDVIFDKKSEKPVTVKANAFAQGVPYADLTTSPAHAYAFRATASRWILAPSTKDVLVRASALVNGSTIVQSHSDHATYWHVELEGGHDVLIANGAAAESFVDHGERQFFSNATSHVKDVVAKDCLPRMKRGKYVRAVRHIINSRVPLLETPEQVVNGSASFNQ